MYQLSEETKNSLSKTIGIPYEKLITMDDEEITTYIEQKNGKKMTYAKPNSMLCGSGDDSVLIDRGRFSTMEEVDSKIDKITKRTRLLDKFKSYLSKKQIKKNKSEITKEKVSSVSSKSTLELALDGSKQMENDKFVISSDDNAKEK